MLGLKILALTIVVFVQINYSQCCRREFRWFAPPFPIRAVAVVKGNVVSADGQVNRVIGTVKFQQNSDDSPVLVNVNISGLPKTNGVETKHGLHIHLFGVTVASDNVTLECGSTGPHFNPLNELHGARESAIRHVGDLGNVVANSDGVISTEFLDRKIQLFGSLSIIGRSIVLHANEDDLGLKEDGGSRAFGNSGARIACGMVGYE